MQTAPEFIEPTDISKMTDEENQEYALKAAYAAKEAALKELKVV